MKHQQQGQNQGKGARNGDKPARVPAVWGSFTRHNSTLFLLGGASSPGLTDLPRNGNQSGYGSGLGHEDRRRSWIPHARFDTLKSTGRTRSLEPRPSKSPKTSFEPVCAAILRPVAMSTIQSIAGENEQHPDVALVERVRGGDVSAYDTLVRKYERQVFRIAQHITQNREDAEDVVQDAFLKAYEKLEQFQGNSKFYTWLVRIAVNESLMRLRKRRTGRMVSIDEDVETEEGSVPRDLADWAPNPEQNYTQAELAEILRKTIQGLPQGFRVVFALRDVEGLSTEETAETLGLSIPAVKSRLLRARLQLRERLSRYFKQKAAPAGNGPAIAPQTGS